MSAFARFQNDFDAMSDNVIIDENRRMEDQQAEAEDWLEAVAAWEDAGRPRSVKPTTPAEAGLGRDEAEGGVNHSPEQPRKGGA